MRTAEPAGQVPARGTLVAGIGNIFFGDDGFGSEVARSLERTQFPEGVRVVDYGIGGTHLAYDLLDGWESLLLIDTVPAHGCPGQVHVLSVDAEQLGAGIFDPHGMDPASVLATLASLGGQLPPTLVVGCEPAVLDEVMGLSPAVAAAVPVAVAIVTRLVAAPSARAETTARERS